MRDHSKPTRATSLARAHTRTHAHTAAMRAPLLPPVAESVHAYIRSWFTNAYSEKAADAMRIQYGGSVTPESVDELMAQPNIDGALVGGASLVGDKFARIVNYKVTFEVVQANFT